MKETSNKKYELDPTIANEINYHLERIKTLVAIHYHEKNKYVWLESRGFIPTEEGLIQLHMLIKPTDYRIPYDYDWNDLYNRFKVKTV